jgi:hypothetical protein
MIAVQMLKQTKYAGCRFLPLIYASKPDNSFSTDKIVGALNCGS